MPVGKCFICRKHMSNCQCKKAASVSNSRLIDGLYGVVEWINGNPVLDGMPYFDDKDAALKYASERADMGAMGLPMKVEYTIVRLKKAI